MCNVQVLEYTVGQADISFFRPFNSRLPCCILEFSNKDAHYLFLEQYAIILNFTLYADCLNFVRLAPICKAGLNQP